MENSKVRKQRTPKDAKEKALNYFVLGLFASDVSKLTGINQRTLERFITVEKWKEKRVARKEAEKMKIIKEYNAKNTK